MPETSSASSSPTSCVSFSSFDEVVPAVTPDSTDGVIKLLCSYGGKIVPRRHDGRLRYVGGHIRMLTVQRSLPFHGLHRRLQELCGWDAVSVRCQLPMEDMEALVSVTGDDDLASVLDEYDAAAARQGTPPQQLRIRVFLFVHTPARRARTTPRSPLTPPLASRRRPDHRLTHATRAWSRFVVMTSLAPCFPARPELCCHCQ
ncbi:hypothetical protein PR202_gb00021 [Eleusine coracana subsp. coracana]|uniref:PB1 domain-containing protein n=1 Tax=Eleusine coracana subsp. coracana TaxID=191504 RepID=A0AAV5DRL6_ELECO|nr:hypothetical protein PR202_gb00021 [Eleusine coracana subsp. coracana]